MISGTVIFKRNIEDYKSTEQINLNSEYSVNLWKPGFKNLIPGSFPSKYILYWIFHFTGIFKNKFYSAVLITHKKKIISRLLIVPSHFKWPFMNKNDVQIAYVVTDPLYGGKGLAAAAIDFALASLNKKVQDVWYVTDLSNIFSIKLCEKMGFKRFSFGKRKYLLGIFRTLVTDENIEK